MLLRGVEDGLHDEVIIGMLHMRDKGLVVVLSAAEPLHIACVALVEEYGDVGYDLVD